MLNCYLFCISGFALAVRRPLFPPAVCLLWVSGSRWPEVCGLGCELCARWWLSVSVQYRPFVPGAERQGARGQRDGAAPAGLPALPPQVQGCKYSTIFISCLKTTINDSTKTVKPNVYEDCVECCFLNVFNYRTSNIYYISIMWAFGSKKNSKLHLEMYSVYVLMSVSVLSL